VRFGKTKKAADRLIARSAAFATIDEMLLYSGYSTYPKNTTEMRFCPGRW
jgi:hypothetical protein